MLRLTLVLESDMAPYCAAPSPTYGERFIFSEISSPQYFRRRLNTPKPYHET